MEKKIVVKVKPVIEIPHTIMDGQVRYTFAPECELPEEIGHSLLRTYPNIYEISDGKFDVSNYKVTDEFKNKSIGDVVDMLSAEGKFEVFAFVKELYKKEQAGKEITEETVTVNVPEKLDKLTKAELFEVAKAKENELRELGIEVSGKENKNELITKLEALEEFSN